MSRQSNDPFHDLAADSCAVIRGRGGAALGRLRGQAASLGWRVHELDGRRMAGKEAMMGELQRGLGLPDYFGRNWDALEECLSDPSVMGDAGGRLVILTGAGEVGRRCPAEFKILLEILAEASRYWRQQSPPRAVRIALFA